MVFQENLYLGKDLNMYHEGRAERRIELVTACVINSILGHALRNATRRWLSAVQLKVLAN